MRYLLYTIFFFTSMTSRAQNYEEYNRIYTNTYLDISQKNFPKALQIADSLYQTSETPYFKIRSLMLSASLFQQSGDVNKAVNYALQAKQLTSERDEDIWKAKIAGFLATQYRNLGLFDQSKIHIDESIKALNNIDNPRFYNQTIGFIKQEQAYYELNQRNYLKSIELIKSSQHYFDLTSQNNPFISSNNDQLLGLNYFYLNDFAKALEYYDLGLDRIKNLPKNYYTALLYNGKANVYIKQKAVKKAEKNLKEAELIAKESNYLSLKNEIYKTSKDFYILTKDIDKVQETQTKQDSVTEKIRDKSVEFINSSYTGLQKENEQMAIKSQEKTMVSIIIFVILLCVVMYLCVYKKRQKQKFKKIQEILDNIDYSKQNTPSPNPLDLRSEEISKENNGNTQQSLMTDATEKKILSQLENFESSSKFVQNSISLPFLAANFDTNTKYLSYVINTHKGKDFNNYINGLRINYIIGKLKKEPKYLKYKISSLAEETGFSSQSKFAAAFKKVTSVSPSEFIKHLKENG